MNSTKYKKMDKFVNEMNQSINIVGDMSIYLFSRFRNFIGYLFITITTVAIAFIVAEFIRGFEFAPIMGIDVYFIALAVSLILGFYIAFYAEEAKIATIKGAIFSSGSNRTWQAIAASAIILVLIIINANGVQKIADFSLRYMDSELQESVVFKLREKKMLNHAALASTNRNTEIQNSALNALIKTKKSYERAKYTEIKFVEQALDSYISGRDPKVYRTYIANKKLESSKKIAKIEQKWSKKISDIDQKILNAQDKLNRRIDVTNRVQQSQMSQADKATEDLIAYYKHESNNNKQIINRYKNIGLIVAIGGEIVDGILAFLLFMIVKSNPNVNGTPQVQANTRKMMKMKSYTSDKSENSTNTTITDDAPLDEYKTFDFSQKEYPFQKEELSDKLFTKIKKVSQVLAKEQNKFVKVGRNRYLNHPSRREIIKAFKDYNIIITPHQIGQYFMKMEGEIMFVNQKLGFVYTQIVEKSAA